MMFFHVVIKSIKQQHSSSFMGSVCLFLGAHWSGLYWCSRWLVIGWATCPSRLWRRQKEAVSGLKQKWTSSRQDGLQQLQHEPHPRRPAAPAGHRMWVLIFLRTGQRHQESLKVLILTRSGVLDRVTQSHQQVLTPHTAASSLCETVTDRQHLYSEV